MIYWELRGENMGSSLRPVTGRIKKRLELYMIQAFTSQWRHNECDVVSNHRRLDCLLNRLFRRRSQKTSNICITRLCDGNPPVTGGFSSAKRKMFPLDDVITTRVPWRTVTRSFNVLCEHIRDQWSNFGWQWRSAVKNIMFQVTEPWSHLVLKW